MLFFDRLWTNYRETPLDSCTVVDVVDGTFSSTRSVSVLARAMDCQGRALAPQTAGDFTPLEDGEPVADAGVALRDPAPLAPFVTVLVDMAALQSAAQETSDAISGALSSLNPNSRVGLSLYGGSDVATELVRRASTPRAP